MVSVTRFIHLDSTQGTGVRRRHVTNTPIGDNRGAIVSFDPDTLFFAAGICAAALAMTMLGVWFQNRMDRFLIGWMLGMALLGSGVIFYAIVPPDRTSVAAAAFTLEIVGFVAVLVAAQQFRGKQVDWSRVVALGLAVAIPVTIPIAGGFDGLGIMNYNFLAAALLTVTAWQYWIVRSEAPVFIAGVTVLYVLSALSFVACGAMLLHGREWTLAGRPDNWAEHINAIMSIAGITGIGALSLALNQSRAARRHRQEARTDALTGLINRRALFDGLSDCRLREGDAVIAFDLDRFKAINDRHGHCGGDQVLRRFADVLRQSARPGDLAARTGGEEFILVMRATSFPVAIAIAERVRAAFAAAEIEAARGVIKGTASAGVALAQSAHESFEEVLNRADAALYRAKDAGRNRVSTELQRVA
jgi:diguanylate cyclase (GGDEF)-like protein